jgi:hypothetical protein
MKRLSLYFAILVLSASAWAQGAHVPDSGATVFAYFKEPGSQGIYFALSRDGYTFTPLNDGQPWIKPEAKDEITRDVFITRNPSGDGFRAVWTWGWRGSTLGAVLGSQRIPDWVVEEPQSLRDAEFPRI